MSNTDGLYIGCPVQHARKFISGKWQMAILWNLKNGAMTFKALKSQLPGISDKIMVQELVFFIEKNIIVRQETDYLSPKTKYTLSPTGSTLIPVITTIAEWGYLNLQDEPVSREMNMTPLPAIDAIENSISEKE